METGIDIEKEIGKERGSMTEEEIETEREIGDETDTDGDPQNAG